MGNTHTHTTSADHIRRKSPPGIRFSIPICLPPSPTLARPSIYTHTQCLSDPTARASQGLPLRDRKAAREQEQQMHSARPPRTEKREQKHPFQKFSHPIPTRACLVSQSGIKRPWQTIPGTGRRGAWNPGKPHPTQQQVVLAHEHITRGIGRRRRKRKKLFRKCRCQLLPAAKATRNAPNAAAAVLHASIPPGGERRSIDIGTDRKNERRVVRRGENGGENRQ